MKRKIWRSNLIVVLFIVIQALDGGYTYYGTSLLGVGIEDNPLLRLPMYYLGIGGWLVPIKTVATLLGCMLHLQRKDWVLIALIYMYLILAIVPWAIIALREF